MRPPIKKAGWQAGLIKHLSSHSTRLTLLLLLAASTGAGLSLLFALAVRWIGGAQ